MPSPIAEFRQSPWVAVIIGIGGACSVAGFAVFWQDAGPNWAAWLFAGLAVLFFLGLVDAVSSSVCLDQDALRIRHNFRRRALKREELSEVSWAKGCPVSVKDRAGSWVQLPALGDSAAMANSIRSWLNTTQRSVPAPAAKPRR